METFLHSCVPLRRHPVRLKMQTRTRKRTQANTARTTMAATAPPGRVVLSSHGELENRTHMSPYNSAYK
ncbi:hypothetical protein DPMN_025818 [Dreissena polymorpha]|uniref:Uncharacterized protein n=1 Tax=Dreissena polymorpha TaxID=45954 RepID=A0A9D4RCW2_DREPO|nr:hypothetical protein DPMN_025818 [Dreissena polymorpha]